VLRGRFTQPDPGAPIEWCNRRVLARIHRLTVGRLRREIEPVTAQQFHRFLAQWQHTASGSRLHGADGLLEIIRQLQGYEAPASAWESQILKARVAKYDPELVDELCLSGEVMWARVSPHPALEENEGRRIRATRLAPIGLLLREDAGWLTGSRPSQDGSLSLSPAARDVLAVLAKGALFFNELARAANRPSGETEEALWELVAAGLVTSDGFENLRTLIDPKRRRAAAQARSTRRRHSPGRWALVHFAEADRPDRVEKWADQLLARWGVLWRDLMARESGAPRWRELLPVLRRMEARGQIRGGRFVAGFTGEQFARREAIDLLRAVRRAGDGAEAAVVEGGDPLNLAGIILPGARLSPWVAVGSAAASV
jgi:ATP-dependent Lhr-like helicase